MKRFIYAQSTLLILTYLTACSANQNPNASDKALQVLVTRPVLSQERPSISALGSINVTSKASLSAGIEGTIQSVIYKEGDLVAQGALLMQLRNLNLDIKQKSTENSIQAARSALELAEAQLAEARRGAEMRLLQNAKLSREIAQKERERQRFALTLVQKEELASIDGVSTDEIQKLRLQAQAFDTEITGLYSDQEAQNLGLNDRDFIASFSRLPADANERKEWSIRLLVRTNQAQVDVARSQLVSAQGELDTLALMLQELSVRAPYAGRIAVIHQQKGERIQAGAPLVSIFADNQVFAEFPLQESELAQLRIGQDLECTVPSLADRLYPATIESLSPTIDPASGNMRIRVRLNNADRALVPGMFTKARIFTGPIASTTRIPLLAWRGQDLSNGQVFTIHQNRAVLLNLDILRQEGEMVLVNNPLPPETLIIQNPSTLIREGTELRYENP